MRRSDIILMPFVILLSCNKEKIQEYPDYGPYQATVSFYDNQTGKKVMPDEVSLARMRFPRSSILILPRFDIEETLKANDTGFYSFKQEPGPAFLLIHTDLYVDIPYNIDGWRIPGNNDLTIPALLTSIQDFKSNFKLPLYKKAITTIRIKQVTKYESSTFNIWLNAYKSSDISEKNKIVRAPLIPEGIYLSSAKRIDTTIVVNLLGDQYNRLNWEIATPLEEGFSISSLGRIDAKKYESANRHEILIEF